MENTDRLFDYEALVKEYNIGQDVLKKLEKEVREDFLDDEMMFELHMIRALEWLYNQNKH